MTDEWTRIDNCILTERIIPALIEIRSGFDCGIPDALDVFAERYADLRKERPGDFLAAEADYGHGFYS